MKSTLLFVLLGVINLNSQDSWFGYGIGLSHLEICSDKVKFRTFNKTMESTYDFAPMKNGELLVYEKWISDEYQNRPNIKIKYLNPEKDSLKLVIGKFTYKFYKDPKFVNVDQIGFSHFKFELISPYKIVKQKIELSKYGILRESNESNKTLFETKVNGEDLTEFYRELEKLDIKNIHLVNRMFNMCNNDEYSFVFIDNNKNRYTYTSMELIRTLEPILSIVETLLAEKKDRRY